jgi:hypothetical protein
MGDLLKHFNSIKIEKPVVAEPTEEKKSSLRLVTKQEAVSAAS